MLNLCHKAININRKLTRNLNFSFNSKKIFKLNKFKFCEKTKNDDQRFYTEFETPEDQTIKLMKFGYKILIIAFKFSVVSGLLYYCFFSKYNNVSKKKRLYFINEMCEIKLAKVVSNKIKEYFKYYIYIKEGEETELIYKIYRHLLEKNSIKIPITKDNVNVIESPSIGAFLSKNGDLFISKRIIELADNKEDEIAFFIAAEIASVLRGDFTYRIFKCVESIVQKTFSEESVVKSTNIITSKRNFLNSFNKFLFFYPECVFTTLYDEVELMRLTLKILNKAEYNLVEVILFLIYLIEYSNNEKI